MRRLLLSSVVLAFVGTSLAGCKQRPTPEQCEDLCWKYNELHFWEKFEAQSADFTPQAKEEARAARQKVWDDMKARSFDPGLKNCVTECKRGGEAKQVPCMEKAETAKAARACLED